MIVRCRTAKGRELAPHYRGLYLTKDTVFHVSPGHRYRVYEMAVFNGGVILLLVDDNRQPVWYPAELFDVEDGSLPAGWHFAFRDGGDSGMQAVWGHPRLVSDPELDGLLAGHDSEAEVIFWREVATQGDRDVSAESK
jgi:hypothetical protein